MYIEYKTEQAYVYIYIYTRFLEPLTEKARE